LGKEIGFQQYNIENFFFTCQLTNKSKSTAEEKNKSSVHSVTKANFLQMYIEIFILPKLREENPAVLKKQNKT